jgi:Divergent InlB B-repeat domain/WD40-like Beta Propeller Repeat
LPGGDIFSSLYDCLWGKLASWEIRVKDLRLQCGSVCGLIIVALAAWLAGCQQQISFPTPVLISISPTEIQAGEPTFSLTVTGKGFTPSSTVVWSSSVIPSATLVSTYDPNTGQLIAQVPALYIQSPGQANISVSSPPPGGGTTTSLTFNINPNPSAVPEITGLSPRSVAAGSAGLTLTIAGKNFVSQSIVMVNGSARSAAFVNSTSLLASIGAGDLTSAGTLQISVFNPPPDGGSSNSFAFNVNNPLPRLTSLSPTSALAGSASVSLVLSGAGFVPQSTILIDGAPRTTAYSSATQLSAALSAGDLTQGGMAQVQVENPGPGGGTSGVLAFAINPTDSSGLPDLVDYAYDGAQANNGICGSITACSGGVPSLTTAGPSISTTGQFVAFASTSTNLLQNQANAASAIFVRDTCLSATTTSGGSSSCVPKTVLVNLGVDGALPNGPAEQPSLDSSGAHVAYSSTATNLVSYSNVDGVTNQIYWQPTCIASSSSTGCSSSGSTGTAALVSLGADGVTPGNGDSYDPVISPDGEYVAFVSLATNLVSGVTVDGVTPQVYIRNTCNVVPPATGGCTPTTYLVSTQDGSSPPIPGDGPSSGPAIANEGLFVSFTSEAENLLQGGNANSSFKGTPEVFERSTCVTSSGTLGGTCVPSTKLVSSSDQVTPADGASIESSVSQDGRFVAFASASTNLISGLCSTLQGCIQQVYASDTCAGVLVTNPPSCTPSLSLVSTPDLTTPGSGTPTPANQPAEDPSINRCITSTSVTISCGTGQFIAFATKATNLGPNVQNGVENVFVRNTCEGVTSTSTTTNCVPYIFLASQPQGTQALPSNGDSIVPSLSGDGHVVGFLSSASNLVANDTNAIPDAFIAGASPSVNLTVAVQGSGSGTVKDSQARVNCVLTTGTQTGTCSANYIYGTSVTLTATAASGYTFAGWGGSVTSTTCPATTDTCTVTLIVANNITATFK